MGGRAGRESDGAHPEREHSVDGAAGLSGRAATAYQRKGLVSKTHTGDLFAVIKIVMPPKPDEKARELWQQLAAAEASFDPRKTWGKA